jgi:glycine/D-amino acid oxidase-like deaminating enzyme
MRNGAASSTSSSIPRRSSARPRLPGLYLNCGWGTGGFKAIPAGGTLLAHLIATGEQHHDLSPAPSISSVSPRAR